MARTGTVGQGPGAAVLDRRALNRALLARQLLLERHHLPVVDAVEHLAGLQAQAPFSPYFSLWSRLMHFAADDLARALVDREVVRLVVMRNTIHLVSAPDALWLRPLTQPIMDRDVRGNTLYGPLLEALDIEDVVAAAREALEGEPRTVKQLGAILAQRWPDRDRGALVHVARARLALVQTPPRAVWGRSGQVRYVTVESWLGRSLDATASLDDLVLRYLRAFGPASVADAQIWSGLTGLAPVFFRLRDSLCTFTDEWGRELFDLPDAPRPDADVPAPVRFLPDYDNLLRAHADRTRVIADDDRRAMNRANGAAPGSVLVDGFVAGAWTTTRSGRAVTLHMEPLRPWRVRERDRILAEARRMLAWAWPEADRRSVVVTDTS
jgi:hypothetical protein